MICITYWGYIQVPGDEYNVSYQKNIIDRDTRDRVVRTESLVESHIKEFREFVEESRKFRTEMVEKHKEYDAIINNERGKLSIILPLFAIIGSFIGWFLRYLIGSVDK